MMEKRNTEESINEIINTALELIRYKLQTGEYHLMLLFMSLYKDGILEKAYKHENKEADKFLVNEMEASEHYKGLKDVYAPILAKLHNGDYGSLFYAFREIDKVSFDEHYISIFESQLLRFQSSQGRSGAGLFLPPDLLSIIHQIADLSGEESIYEPFASYASIGASLPSGLRYLATEETKYNWAIGQLRLMAHGQSYEKDLHYTDSIRNWPDDRKFDCIVANPPIGLRFENPGYGIYYPEYKTVEHFLVDKGISSLADNGKMVLLLGTSFLQSSQWLDVRKRLIDDDLLETVVALPKGLLSNTYMASVILVFNKTKASPNKVKLLDVSELTIDSSMPVRIPDLDTILQVLKNEKASFFKSVDASEIIAQDYNLGVGRYFIDDIVIDLAEEEELIRIGDLISFCGGEQVSRDTKARALKPRDMSTDNLDYILAPESLDILEAGSRYRLFSESCLLVSSMGNPLRVSVFNYDETSILVPRDVFAIKVDTEKIDQAHLVNELFADYVSVQIKTYTSSSVLPRITRADFLNVRIKVPTLELQKAKVLDHRRALIAEKELELKSMRQEADLYEADQLSVIRHKVAGRLTNLELISQTFSTIIENQILPQISDVYDLRKSERSKMTLGRCLEILERDIKMVKKVFEKPELLKDKSEYEVFDFVKFITEYVGELRDQSSYEINDKDTIFVESDFPIIGADSETDFDDQLYSPRQIYIRADKAELRSVLDNLKENAERHAFDAPADNKLRIECIVNRNSEHIQVSVSNTGKPLPGGFKLNDFVRQGISSDVEKGDGYGGYYIDRVLRNLGSKIEVVNHAIDPVHNWAAFFEYVTTFEFKLSIENM